MTTDPYLFFVFLSCVWLVCLKSFTVPPMLMVDGRWMAMYVRLSAPLSLLLFFHSSLVLFEGIDAKKKYLKKRTTRKYVIRLSSYQLDGQLLLYWIASIWTHLINSIIKNLFEILFIYGCFFVVQFRWAINMIVLRLTRSFFLFRYDRRAIGYYWIFPFRPFILLLSVVPI